MADTPSKYQQVIYDAVTAGTGDIIVNSVAGHVHMKGKMKMVKWLFILLVFICGLSATPAHAAGTSGYWRVVQQWHVERGYTATEAWSNTEDALPGRKYAIYARAPKDGQQFSVVLGTNFLNRDDSTTFSNEFHTAHHPIFVRVSPPDYPTRGWQIAAWASNSPAGTFIRLLIWVPSK